MFFRFRPRKGKARSVCRVSQTRRAPADVWCEACSTWFSSFNLAEGERSVGYVVWLGPGRETPLRGAKTLAMTHLPTFRGVAAPTSPADRNLTKTRVLTDSCSEPNKD